MTGFAAAIAKHQQTVAMGVTVDEAARMLGISPGAVRQALTAGRLLGVKWGARMWAVNRESVESYRSRVSRRGPKARAR